MLLITLQLHAVTFIQYKYSLSRSSKSCRQDDSENFVSEYRNISFLNQTKKTHKETPHSSPAECVEIGVRFRTKVQEYQ